MGFQASGDLPRCLPRWWLATTGCREPASSDRLPVHRSESPTGYSSAGCSPAEPASASPVTDNSSSIPIRRGNRLRCSFSQQGCSSGPCPAFGCSAVSRLSAANGSVISTLRAGCHFYLAPTTSPSGDGAVKRPQTAPTTAARCDRQQRQELPQTGLSSGRSGNPPHAVHLAQRRNPASSPGHSGEALRSVRSNDSPNGTLTGQTPVPIESNASSRRSGDLETFRNPERLRSSISGRQR